MRTLSLMLTIGLCYWLSAAADELIGDKSAGAKKASDCLQCHNTPISLKARGVEKMVDQMKAIRAGDKGHPPGLSEMSEQDLLDIATYLNDA